MHDPCFDVEIENGIAHLILCRAEKRNSMIAPFWRELPTVLERVQADGSVRVIVISSTGPHFSSGMDLSVLSRAAPLNTENSAATDGNRTTVQEHVPERADTHEHGQAHAHEPDAIFRSRQRALRFRDLVRRLQQTFNAIEEARIPVLAAVQGSCIGAAVDMVCACDMRYATTDASFIIHETNLAMTADVGTFPRLCKLIPDGLVRELAYTGRPLGAQEAWHSGLVNRVFESRTEMLDGVMQIATQIAAKAPMALHGCKRMILHARDHTVADTLDYVSVWNAAFFQQQEVHEAVQAGREGRQASFAPLPPLSSDDDPVELP